MRTTIFPFHIFLLLSFMACETSRSPESQIEISGIWRGQIDSMVMEMRLSSDGPALGGEVVWQVGDPSYMADVGVASFVERDSVYILLTNFDPPTNIASLSGRMAGNVMSGVYRRLHESAPLSDSGSWIAVKQN